MVVAIDIGHSIQAPGTRSARGVPEYIFNKRQATAIVEEAGQDFPNLHVIILNDQGRNISLRQRVQMSVNAGASIFISIHHDSAQKRYLRQWTYKGKSLDHTPAIHGFSLFISPQEKNGPSRHLAAEIATRMIAAGRVPSDHHAEDIPGERRLLLDRFLGIYAAPFGVLVRSAIPAVLVEFGVIRNKDEEAQLAKPAMRQKLAKALLQGIARFCRNDPAGCDGCQR